ncbi:MAG: Maf family protein [Pseudomonadota bacterium]
MLKKYRLILASQSPRRRELLQWLNIPFIVKIAGIDENSSAQGPTQMAQDIATLKGQAVYTLLQRKKDFGQDFFPFIIAADTLVVLDNHVLGKPKNVADARRMLLLLSGKTHQVITAVYLGAHDRQTGEWKEKYFSTLSDVRFNPISEDLLNDYLRTKESLDKAGAYGIQGPALTFISQVYGSYSNVVGFPLAELVNEMKSFLGHAEDNTGQWRKMFVTK